MQQNDNLIDIGVAEVDITPDYPIRLSGYGIRREETTQVETRLRAKALALGADHEKPALLITVENCGVTDAFTEEVAARLKAQAGIDRTRLVICYSHTHTGPCLTGAAPMLFSSDIPTDHQKAIDRYTVQLADKMVETGLMALAERQPCRLDWAEGHVGFAANRRPQVGPVDHVMPLLRFTGPDGRLRAVWLSYACHCTTLGGDTNYICGDWAGYAQEIIEREYPGAMAFVSIGCAADANPYPRSTLDYARQHGKDIAHEANRLLKGGFTPITGCLSGNIECIDLPFDTLPTHDEWKTNAAQEGPVGYHAGKWLGRLECGEIIPTTQSYPIQVWTFGDDLAMVFLTGEVVADYALRLRRIFDPQRLWIGAYANAFPGYIPSRRVWNEGGYEGGDATVYFGLPNRFAEDIEELIIETIRRLIPFAYCRKA